MRKSLLRGIGTSRDGEVPIVELAGHPCYVATLFLPQLGSQPGRPRPLALAFLDATRNFRHARIDAASVR